MKKYIVVIDRKYSNDDDLNCHFIDAENEQDAINQLIPPKDGDYVPSKFSLFGQEDVILTRGCCPPLNHYISAKIFEIDEGLDILSLAKDRVEEILKVKEELEEVKKELKANKAKQDELEMLAILKAKYEQSEEKRLDEASSNLLNGFMSSICGDKPYFVRPNIIAFKTTIKSNE